MITELELDRDVAGLRAKILQASKAMIDFATAIDQEFSTQAELKFYIEEEARRVEAGQRSLYDVAALRANMDRCKANIQTFQNAIERERTTIKRIEEIIATIQDDFQRPNVIVIDMQRRETYDPRRPHNQLG